MLRRLLVALAGASLCVAVLAVGSQAQAHGSRTLVMTRSGFGVAAHPAGVRARAAAGESASTVYQGFKCEVTVGIGANGQTAKNYFTNDSNEFTIAYTEGGSSLLSVTTNCVGKLPPGTVHSTSIVSHAVACRQFDPTSMTAPTIQGYGISTTYPGGLFSETCNTPNYLVKAVVPTGSCSPSSSLGVLALVSGKNVVAYVPKGNWELADTGVSAVNVEGSSITPTDIPTPNAVNSTASDALTGETVGVTNGTDVYTFSGTTLTHTLTDGGSGTLSFSGGFPTTASEAMDATHDRAVIGLSTPSGPGFQFLNLSSNTFGTPFASPSGAISEDPLVDPIRNLLLSPAETGNFEIVDVANPSTPVFYENATGGGELDSAAEDCSTGIALAPAEFSDPSSLFIADLTQAKFTPGTPAGAWTAPSQNQILSESSLSAGPTGIAVAQGTHTGVVTGEFGGNELTGLALPTTSGSGIPAIKDWVSCAIPNTPDGNPWNEGDDPHTVTAYQSPNSGDAIGLFGNGGASWLARVDLTKLLNPSVVPRDTANEACASGTLPSSVVSFIPVP